jgi:hypothetical protein
MAYSKREAMHFAFIGLPVLFFLGLYFHFSSTDAYEKWIFITDPTLELSIHEKKILPCEHEELKILGNGEKEFCDPDRHQGEPRKFKWYVPEEKSFTIKMKHSPTGKTAEKYIDNKNHPKTFRIKYKDDAIHID